MITTSKNLRILRSKHLQKFSLENTSLILLRAKCDILHDPKNIAFFKRNQLNRFVSVKNQFKSFFTRIEVIAEGAATAHDYCEINYFISVLLLMSFNGTVEHF